MDRERLNGSRRPRRPSSAAARPRRAPAPAGAVAGETPEVSQHQRPPSRPHWRGRRHFTVRGRALTHGHATFSPTPQFEMRAPPSSRRTEHLQAATGCIGGQPAPRRRNARARSGYEGDDAYLPPKSTRRVSGRRSSMASSSRDSNVLSMMMRSPAVARMTPPHAFLIGLSALKVTSISLTNWAPFSFSAHALYLATALVRTFLIVLFWPETPRTLTEVPSRRTRPSTMRLSSRDAYLSDCTRRPRRFFASSLRTAS
mmetsp:Transcript_8354/g.24539  ORF Transcript_8354/g.24539 Transcript_8354/m.24539 type:complete len:257 (-) Transcript_8354:334-1104(-)